MSQTIVVGMSGGVDSSVAALLLKQKGYNVIGLFMNNWEEQDGNGVCHSAEDYEDAKSVCNKLEIPCYSVNFSKEYYENVFKHFLKEYERGRTPNPDVLCNREIKFKPFIDYALKLGADKIATGHYAGVEEIDGKFYLKKAKDKSKDQTYFLNQLSGKQLERVIFPLDKIEKTEVRKLAETHGLITARKKDSTGICFIGERNFKSFLEKYLPNKPGNIVSVSGELVGRHSGLMYYTKGQRKGLGIGGDSRFESGRWFVADKDLKNNILVVSCKDESVLYSKALKTYNINWIPERPMQDSFECYAQVRYRQPYQKVNVKINGEGANVEFKEKQRAVTEGQYVVFYNENYCLGGGVIEEVF